MPRIRQNSDRSLSSIRPLRACARPRTRLPMFATFHCIAKRASTIRRIHPAGTALLARPGCPTLTGCGSFKRPLSGPFDGLTRSDLGRMAPLPLAWSCEGALRVHVAALRKALGDGRAGKRYIVNNPGRGYSFAAPVAREQRQPAIAPTNGAAVRGNLQALLNRIVGRDDIIAALAAQLAQRRFLTIVGPGGIGKTTVAIAVAESVSASFDDGVWFVGLASLPDPDLVASALSTVLGISLPGVNPISGLAAWLRDKRTLIVLDSCEHVIGAVAGIAEKILTADAGVSILATSREPLRAEGEWLHRLTSLELPPRSDNLTPEGALQYSAVQLFNERALATIDGFALGDEDVAPVIEICRRLDGMPLALELAAARVDVFGIKSLAARLDDRFAVLTSGRRTALPRHQTLRAAMD